jgi:hypothetical protein
LAAATKKRGTRAKMGRPKGSGGPPESVRRNRVTATFTDAELADLERMAAAREVPVGTLLYEFAKRALKRKR